MAACESVNLNKSATPLAGAWSRLIDEEHRIVYLVEGDDIVILQARFHYT